jgi:Gluconate 2-dehydrogenase subunit 3
MKRRDALSSFGLGLASIVSMPAWANKWQKDSPPSSGFLNFEEKNLLTELSETIIPTTDTPGAKSLGVPTFIELMLKDCYTTTDQKAFKKGLEKTDELAKNTFGKAFTDCNASQKLHILKGMQINDDADLKKFYNVLRGLTVRAYTSSEHYMVNVQKWEFAPARYIGCVDIKK